jgi:hypothetical protein
MKTTMTVEEMLSDVAERMAGVVDAGMRARLTGEYLALLQTWHSYPSSTLALQAPGFAQRVKTLDTMVRRSLLQYKLEPGFGDLETRVEESLQAAMSSMQRLSSLAAAQKELTVRRRWEARLMAIAERLQRVDDELVFANTSVNLSRMSSLKGTVDNLMAVEMLPLELEWSRALGVTPPNFTPSNKVESGALSITSAPELWRQGLSGPDGAAEMLTAYNQAVTADWQEQSGAVLARAAGAVNAFNATVLSVADSRRRLVAQAQWLGGQKARADFPALKAHLTDFKASADSLALELKGLAESINASTYDRYDEPEQMVRKHLGDLSRDKAAVALLYWPQINALAGSAQQLAASADEFDRETGLRTGR